jgi:hypothetical protein
MKIKDWVAIGMATLALGFSIPAFAFAWVAMSHAN